MESLKKPEMILSIANTFGLISLAIYAYKRSILLNDEIAELKVHVGNLTRKIGELSVLAVKTNDLSDIAKQADSSNKTRDTHIKSHTDTLKNVSYDIDDLANSLNAIIKALKENGINVKVDREEAEVSVLSSRNKRQQQSRYQQRYPRQQQYDDDEGQDDIEPDNEASYRPRRY